MRPADKQPETTGKEGEAVKQPPVRRHGPLTIEDITTKPLTTDKIGRTFPLVRRFLTFRRHLLCVVAGLVGTFPSLPVSGPFLPDVPDSHVSSDSVLPSEPFFVSRTLPLLSDMTCLWTPSVAFSLFGVGTMSFHSRHSSGLCFFSLRSCLLHVFSFKIIRPQFWSSYPIFWCPLTSIFHVLITTSVSLSSCPNYLGLASLFFSLMFATPALALISSVLILSILFLPIIHLNILISGPTHILMEAMVLSLMIV